MKRSLLGSLALALTALPFLHAQNPAPTKLLLAFSSYKERSKHPTIFFYEHDGVSNGKIVGSVGLPRGADASARPSLSHDGRFCFFTFEVENKTSKVVCWDRTENKSVDLPEINESKNAILGPSVSGDGNLVAFYAWNRPGGPGPGYHVFLLDRSAKKLLDLPGLNSQSFDDRVPNLSSTGRFLAFASNRKGGLGLTDLYLYDREASKLIDVPGLNSTFTELEPALSADGNLIAFSSERAEGAGGRDIYLFDRKQNKMLPLPGLNREGHEVSPSLSADGRYLVFVAERLDGEGDRDVYLFDREKGQLLPTPGLNSKAEDFDPCVIVLKSTE